MELQGVNKRVSEYSIVCTTLSEVFYFFHVFIEPSVPALVVSLFQRAAELAASLVSPALPEKQ